VGKRRSSPAWLEKMLIKNELIKFVYPELDRNVVCVPFTLNQKGLYSLPSLDYGVESRGLWFCDDLPIFGPWVGSNCRN
jgi:hypothetical protein